MLKSQLGLADVLREVVAPLVDDLLRPGEVDSITLAWRTGRGGSSPLPFEDAPDWRDVPYLDLQLMLVGDGEPYTFDITTPDDALEQIDLGLIESEIAQRLERFVEELRSRRAAHGSL